LRSISDDRLIGKKAPFSIGRFLQKSSRLVGKLTLSRNTVAATGFDLAAR
jgi:hypothetical protein